MPPEQALITTAQQVSDKRLFQFLWEWPRLLDEMNAAQARGMLEQFGTFYERLDKAETLARMNLGKLLLAIHKRKLWGAISGHAMWGDFLKKGLEGINSKLGYRSCYDAMELAKTESLTNLPAEELAKIKLANARTIAKVERAKGTPVPRNVIEKAKTTSNREFKRAVVGPEKGATVQLWFPDSQAAEQASRLLEQIRGASAEALEMLVELLSNTDLLALTAGGINNRLDYINAAVGFSIDSDRTQGKMPPIIVPSNGEAVEEVRP